MAGGTKQRKDERRKRKFERQGGLCHWCKQPMTLEMYRRPQGAKPPRNYASFEHLQRRRDGGSGKHNNVVLACSRCNSSRDQGVQISKPKWENVAAKRMKKSELLAKLSAGTMNDAERGELYTRGLVPNWPMWSKLMAAAALCNP
jgi:5-methylcytosine-specific restriction endonuclease McrA